MRRKFSESFKQRILAEQAEGLLPLRELAKKYDIETRLLKSWIREREASPEPARAQERMTG